MDEAYDDKVYLVLGSTRREARNRKFWTTLNSIRVLPLLRKTHQALVMDYRIEPSILTFALKLGFVETETFRLGDTPVTVYVLTDEGMAYFRAFADKYQ